MKRFYAALLVALLPAIGSAQSTAESISAIFQANCTTGCHSGSNPSANLNLSGGASDLVGVLVDADPLNPAALAKGYKLVDPGHPHNSYLLYKCAYEEWDDQYGMDQEEGEAMPSGQPVLEKEEVELIRQWILGGANATGVDVSPQLLYDYYHVNGMARVERPEAPAVGEGYQVHMGPFFLAPGDETEFFKKEKLHNEELHNVVKWEPVFNSESHHFLLYEFPAGSEGGIEEGLRPVTIQNAFQNPYMVGWVDEEDVILPEGTAYKLRENAVIDLNYHLINYASNGDSILAAEAYVNYYVDNSSPNLIEMESELMINFGIVVVNNGQEWTFTSNFYDGNSTDTLYIWYLSSHTHKYGNDYDIYKRNPDGSKGEQLYEGFFNTTYDFNQGYYDWQHPARRYFDELLPVAENSGLMQETTYQINDPNETSSVILFGATTDDEMMVGFVQYTREPIGGHPNSVSSLSADSKWISVYPNPTEGTSTIQFSLDEKANVQLNVYNSLGQEVSRVYNGSMNAGQVRFDFDASAGLDPNGLYLVQLMVDGKIYTERLLHLKR